MTKKYGLKNSLKRLKLQLNKVILSTSANLLIGDIISPGAHATAKRIPQEGSVEFLCKTFD